MRADALNGGWVYHDRIGSDADGMEVTAYYATRHPHSDGAAWARRLRAGEIRRNGTVLPGEATLRVGDRLAWHRPPWREEAVPDAWTVIHDDGDLHVIDKPSGLPVLPAGGFLEHTVLRLLEARCPPPAPRPVHRLGRFTSGLLLCARSAGTRAWLSARLRAGDLAAGGCLKLYRALLCPGALPLAVGGSLRLTTPIGRRAHPLLGQIWCADPAGLPAESRLTLLERRGDADLVEVAIASGRPHQIRIHCAALGVPLLGDPLYLPGGAVAEGARPGQGGYRLHAQRLRLGRPDGTVLNLEAPLPQELRCGSG